MEILYLILRFNKIYLYISMLNLMPFMEDSEFHSANRILAFMLPWITNVQQLLYQKWIFDDNSHAVMQSYYTHSLRRLRFFISSSHIRPRYFVMNGENRINWLMKTVTNVQPWCYFMIINVTNTLTHKHLDAWCWPVLRLLIHWQTISWRKHYPMVKKLIVDK